MKYISESRRLYVCISRGNNIKTVFRIAITKFSIGVTNGVYELVFDCRLK